MKKQLGLIPELSPQTPSYFEISNHHLNDVLERIFVYKGYLVFYRESTKPFMGKYLKNQLELPIEATEWLVNVIENLFMNKPSEGGLEKGVFNTSTTINGEGLYIRWGVSVAGERVGGYTIFNGQRKDYIAIKFPEPQDFVIAGDIMVEQVLPVLKEIAQKFKNGDFSE